MPSGHVAKGQLAWLRSQRADRIVDDVKSPQYALVGDNRAFRISSSSGRVYQREYVLLLRELETEHSPVLSSTNENNHAALRKRQNTAGKSKKLELKKKVENYNQLFHFNRCTVRMSRVSSGQCSAMNSEQWPRIDRFECDDGPRGSSVAFETSRFFS